MADHEKVASPIKKVATPIMKKSHHQQIKSRITDHEKVASPTNKKSHHRS
jgi:hypothetical protein